MNDLKKENIDGLLDLFANYKQVQTLQKMRGLNDFNIFTTVLKKHDEVRLHSRFIAYLLSPSANHYQDTLFLKLFLEEIGLPDFFADLSKCRVYREYENIDIYVTDENRHIVIENKVYAGDQNKQIKRHIEKIKKDNADLGSDDLVVIYLSLSRKYPERISLGNWRINDGNISSGEKSYKFKSIHYNNEITNWLEDALKQVANITNLAVGLTQYREVVAKLCGNYGSKVMTLDEYIEQYTGDKTELLTTMRQVSREYSDLRVKYIQDFWNEVIRLLHEKMKDYPGWKIPEPGENLFNGEKWYYPLRVLQENSKVMFGFEYHSNDFHGSLWGIRKNKSIDITRIQSDPEIDDLLKTKNDILKKRVKSKGWLAWAYYHKGNLFDKIISKNIESAPNDFVNEFMNIFKNYKDIVIKCNEILDDSKL